jgi:nucleotide-binding universal stress UspA family protein
MVHQPRQAESRISFDNVVCAVDASPESRETACQAAALAAADARLWAVSVWDPGLAMYAGIHATEVAIDLRDEAATALEDARNALPGLEPILIEGGQVAGLLATIANLEADLVSVGAHGISRPAGIVFGSVATAMAHHAPCSVLVGRRTAAESFPDLILHASDGSPESVEAARVAGQIAARHEAEVVTLHVGDDPKRGSAAVEEASKLIRESGREPVGEVEPGSPHRRIIEVATEREASLIVIGSRGLTGLQALGSVSERVSHRASCSVLIVRYPSHPSTEADAEGLPEGPAG